MYVKKNVQLPEQHSTWFDGERIKTRLYKRLLTKKKCQLTVSRCLPCLKSLIPDSLLSMHSSPPHCAMTPAILYTSSSSSSSSVRGQGKIFFKIQMRFFFFYDCAKNVLILDLHSEQRSCEILYVLVNLQIKTCLNQIYEHTVNL